MNYTENEMEEIRQLILKLAGKVFPISVTSQADAISYAHPDKTLAKTVKEAIDEIMDNFQGEPPGIIPRITAIERALARRSVSLNNPYVIMSGTKEFETDVFKWTPADALHGTLLVKEDVLARVWIVGGGGGGAAATSRASVSSSGAGGSSGSCVEFTVRLTENEEVPITLGAGGSGGTSTNYTGGHGGSTVFGSYVSAYGGIGGQGYSTYCTAWARDDTTLYDKKQSSARLMIGQGRPSVTISPDFKWIISGTGGRSPFYGSIGAGQYSNDTAGVNLPGANAAGCGHGGSGASVFYGAARTAKGGAGAPGGCFIELI